ncbi:patatin-like phospholipase family protein [Bifidobacterium gallicum]|uniref:Phospholipase n=1 Tax=Bifidobacterium gallicum DSM 20093 = LMG 11596 TaxID=561180 RepID=D1NTJ9_9BIFI|nr:patatin family protein [Bifidobacterium gallicum]EFA23053.1 phospholipase, patatin family [Bifidobacterium gallicum DSM 20093 = LMG 11596]KFI57644.1 phospholipase [Bifidobacterium gallicum DSM 20093 = LMG 11596]
MATQTAIIDVGGGFRAIYSCGVEDYLMAHGIEFDHAYGVSAGSANLASFVARQPGRSYKFYSEYASRREYASAHELIRHRNFVNLDYVYSTLSNHDGEYPLDYEAFANNPTQFTVVACNAEDGSTKYFTKDDVSFDNFDIFKASSAVPVACRPYVIDGVPYYDGGIADPVPVQRALDDGADKIVVLLTRLPEPREASADEVSARILSRFNPVAGERLAKRYQVYNDEVAFARELEQEGRAIVIEPHDIHGLSTLHRSFENSEAMYREGFADGAKVEAFLAK